MSLWSQIQFRLILKIFAWVSDWSNRFPRSPVVPVRGAIWARWWFGQKFPPNTNRFQKFWLRWNREGRFRPAPPSNRGFLSGCERSGQKSDIQNFENANTSKFHRQIRTNLQTFDPIVTARVDWGRSRPQFDDFSTGSNVFTENMNFHTSEPPKNRISRSLSKFSRHGSSRASTDQSIPWKFCFSGRSFLFGTQLRSSVPSTKIIAN